MSEEIKVGDLVRHRGTGDEAVVTKIEEVTDRPDGITTLVTVRFSRFGYGYGAPDHYEKKYAPVKSESIKGLALKFECPRCGAPVDSACTTADGVDTDIHAGRKALVAS